MPSLILYSTLGCHLCEDAKAVLNQLDGAIPFTVQEVEISEREEWVESYGVRIPVLKSTGSEDELDWPFDVESCRQWLSRL